MAYYALVSLDLAIWPGPAFSVLGTLFLPSDSTRAAAAVPVNSKGGAEQMASKAGARIKITLRCSECKQRNYNTMKNKKKPPTVWS